VAWEIATFGAGFYATAGEIDCAVVKYFGCPTLAQANLKCGAAEVAKFRSQVKDLVHQAFVGLSSIALRVLTTKTEKLWPSHGHVMASTW
jgi:hypothetical protein